MRHSQKKQWISVIFEADNFDSGKEAKLLFFWAFF